MKLLILTSSNIFMIFCRYLWKTASGGLFMSNLYVIDTFEKQQAAVSSWETCVLLSPLKTASDGLFMSYLCVLVTFEKQQAAVSSWATCVLLLSLKNSQRQPLHEQLVCHCYLWKIASDSLFMSNLCVIVTFEKKQAAVSSCATSSYWHLWKNSKRRSLHAQLVCYCYIWKNSKCQYLHEQLICYGYFWKTTSGGLFMSNLYVIDTFKKQQAAVSSWETCVLLLSLKNSKRPSDRKSVV